MTEYTTTQTIHRALKYLGRLYEGDAPSSEDYASALEILGAAVEQWAADDVVYVSDIDAIEGVVWLPVCRLLALECANDFGNDAVETLLTRTRAANVDALQEREYTTLRRLQAKRPTYQVAKGEFF